MVTLYRNTAKLNNMPRIEDNLLRIKQKLKQTCRLIVVSKYRTVPEIEEAYRAGQRLFGENRVQALLERKDALPQDIEWHLIGHLQTNKVKFIAPFIAMIHSVDSLKLLKEINLQGAKNNRVIPCLLQIYVASEDTKFGLEEADLFQLLKDPMLEEMEHIEICGLMAMATLTDNTSQIQREFEHAKRIFDAVKQSFFANKPKFCELSMGMSSDYQIAQECGSTLVRIGSSIFA